MINSEFKITVLVVVISMFPLRWLMSIRAAVSPIVKPE